MSEITHNHVKFGSKLGFLEAFLKDAKMNKIEYAGWEKEMGERGGRQQLETRPEGDRDKSTQEGGR